MATVTVGLEIKNQRVKEDLEEILSSMEGFQLLNSNNLSTRDLLIFEIGSDFKQDFETVHSIQACRMAGEIFLTSSHLDPNLLIQAIKAGAKEFFPQPVRREEMIGALLKFKERQENATQGENKLKIGKILNVLGSKGGIGTTTVAVNLATSLRASKSPPSVALIDMNLLFGEIPLFLDLESKSAFNWGEAVRNISRLDSTYLMSIFVKHSSGIYVLPSPTELDETNVATPEIIEQLLNLMKDVFDFIVIDSGQSLDAISLKILEMSDIILLVAMLSLPCVTNLQRLLRTFQRLGYPREDHIKILISRYHKKSLISLKEAEQSIKKEIFWLIPDDYPTTISAINLGKPLNSVVQGAQITKNFKELASHFWEARETKKGKSGLLSRILRTTEYRR